MTETGPDISPGTATRDKVATLEATLWKRLAAAQSPDQMAQSWAPLMFAMLDGAEAVSVFLKDPDTGGLRAAAGFPEARLPGARQVEAAEGAMAEKRGMVRGTMPDPGRPAELISVAVPLILGDQVLGAVGAELRPLDRGELQLGMRQLQWGAAWMRDALRTVVADAARQRYDNAVDALHVVVSAAEQQDFSAAARAAVTDLANRFGCDRVSVGFRRLRRTKVAAISHSAQFGKEMNLVRMLAAAMDEAIDQRGVVIWPETDVAEPMATHRHEKLAQAHTISNLLTCPLYATDRFIGALVFERPADHPFTQDDAEILEAVSTVLAPVLQEIRENDRWVITRAGQAVGRFFKRLVGPSHLALKASVLGAACLVAIFATLTMPDRINADARVEGAVQRAIKAPFDGFIAESEPRAGDLVAQGDLLARLDDRDLTLERLRLVSQLGLQQIEFDKAVAARDRSESAIRRNQIAQAETQIALIDQQIARTRITAPFDGIIASGDLSQAIGASVVRGDELMTMVPDGDFRVILQVDEARISEVMPGQLASLVVTALPETSFALQIDRITPVASYGDGRTRFRVDAQLIGETDRLQPGMEGVAKIETGERLLIAIWTRPLRDWARIAAWRWMGWHAETGAR